MKPKKLTLEEWNQMCHKWIRRKGGKVDHDPKCPCGVPEPKPEWRRLK